MFPTYSQDELMAVASLLRDGRALCTRCHEWTKDPCVPADETSYENPTDPNAINPNEILKGDR